MVRFGLAVFRFAHLAFCAKLIFSRAPADMVPFLRPATAGSGAVHVDPSERGQGSGDAMQLILKSYSLFLQMLNYSGHVCH
jgi:hypothetical protein